MATANPGPDGQADGAGAPQPGEPIRVRRKSRSRSKFPGYQPVRRRSRSQRMRQVGLGLLIIAVALVVIWVVEDKTADQRSLPHQIRPARVDPRGPTPAEVAAARALLKPQQPTGGPTTLAEIEQQRREQARLRRERFERSLPAATGGP